MGLHHSSTCAEKIELFYNIPSLESVSILYKKTKREPIITINSPICTSFILF